MNLVELILSIGSFNGLLIGAILISLNNANRTATILFGVTVILFSLIIVEELSEYKGWIFQYPRLLNIADSFTLLIGPLLYLYAQLITERKKNLKTTDLFHALPFLLFIVFLLPFYILPDDQKLGRIDYDPSGVINALKALITAVYLIYTLRFIVRFVRSQKMKGFPVNNYQNIRWFKGLMVSLVVLGMLIMLLTILFRQGVALPFDPDTFSVLAISVLFWTVSVNLMRHPFLFWSMDEMNLASQRHFERSEEKEDSTRYKTSPLTRTDLEQNMQKLTAVMQEQSPYLNPELTPVELEEATGIKAYYISQTLNEVLNKNFYEFINAYRVEAVKKLILSEDQAHKTILALGLESGFNSKSSFNRVFKQYTGITPSQFKKKHSNQE